MVKSVTRIFVETKSAAHSVRLVYIYIYIMPIVYDQNNDDNACMYICS